MPKYWPKSLSTGIANSLNRDQNAPTNTVCVGLSVPNIYVNIVAKKKNTQKRCYILDYLSKKRSICAHI